MCLFSRAFALYRTEYADENKITTSASKCDSPLGKLYAFFSLRGLDYLAKWSRFYLFLYFGDLSDYSTIA